MTYELKPCPFCGCKEIEFSEVSLKEEPALYCFKCGVMSFDVTTWNTRVEQTCGMVSKDGIIERLNDIMQSSQYSNEVSFGLHKAIKAIEAMPCSDDWQPIETAPKDGTRFLGYLGKQEPSVIECWWQENFSNWTGLTDDWDTEPKPTHWMSLPNPPKTKERGDGW